MKSKTRKILGVIIRLLLFLFVSVQIAMSFAVLFMFTISDFFIPTPINWVNIAIRFLIDIVYFVAAFAIWCWIGYLILSPLANNKKNQNQEEE